jgi:hypothetical protein
MRRPSLLFAAVVAVPCRAVEPEPALPYDLSAVRGIEHFPQDPGLRALLARNGFAVVPYSRRQVFSAYLESPLPPLVTVEGAVRTYQVILEGGLRLLEKAQARRLLRLSERLVAALRALEVEGLDMERARARLLALAGVGLHLQDAGADLDGLPADVRRLVDAEIAKIRAGRLAPSEIHEREEGLLYGHLEPTGVYAREPDLAAYFRAAKWYGLTSFRVREAGEPECALLLAAAALRDPEVLRIAGEISAPLDELLGPPDDITVAQAAGILGKLVEDGNGALYGPRLAAILPRFTEALAALPLPRINDQVLGEIADPRTATQGVRLLAPRYTWEAELAAKLGDGARPLHVLIVLGDERAAAIATREGSDKLAEEARSEGSKLFGAAPATVYRASVEAIEPLFRALPEGAPPFARTDAWRTYSTWAALGSWTCLRHSWELHAKEVVVVFGSMMGRAGYVVPYAEAFERLRSAALRASEVLERSGAYEETASTTEAESAMPGAAVVKKAFADFAVLMGDLARISRKQLVGEELEKAEREVLAGYGERLGRLHLYPADSYVDPLDDMPIAVLFSTVVPAGGEPRERYAAVGRAADVYAIRRAPAEEARGERGEKVLLPPGLQLYHGSTLSVYEVDRREPGARLTDETWKALLDSEDAPQFPAWAADFTTEVRATPLERLAAGEWMPELERARGPDTREAALRGYLAARGAAHLRLFLDCLEPADADHLVDLAQKTNEPGHLAAIASAFAEKASPDAREAVLAGARSGPEPLAVLAVRAAGENACVDRLEEALGSTEMGRWGLALILEDRLGAHEIEDAPPLDPAIIPALERLAGDASPLVRAGALHAFAHAPGKRAVPLLRKALEDESPFAREAAAHALLDLGDAPSVPFLARVLWYIADRAVRERNAGDARRLDRLRDTFGLLLEQPLFYRLRDVSPELVAAFDAAMLVEEPFSNEWGSTAREAAPDLWRKAVLAVALDPSRSFDERSVVLAILFSKPDPDLARGLAPLLDDTSAPGLAQIAAEVILGALGGGESHAPAGPSVIDAARAALGKLDAAPSPVDWTTDHQEG